MTDRLRDRQRFQTWLVLPALALLAASVLACDESDAAPEEPDPPAEVLEVEVEDDGLDPGTVEVRVPDRYQLVVTNESSEDCSFSLGTYVRDLSVPAGGTSQIDVQLPPETPEGEVTMGCDGSGERTGTVVVLGATATD